MKQADCALLTRNFLCYKKALKRINPLTPNLGGKKVRFFETSKIAHSKRAISYVIKKQTENSVYFQFARNLKFN
ncbi:MAG: hypothetical protein SPF92_07820 [Clostridia bacterium]|nr:hypothetical protein [Clostridia bacterium]